MSDGKGANRSLPWLKRAFVALLGVCLGGLMAEAGLRLAGFSYMIFERPDLVRGISLQPRASGWQTLEGRAYVTINSHGYHDRERDERKPDGVYRIAVVGDSFVEARQIALEDSFCSLLEGMLNRAPHFEHKSVEVLSFGVSGYGTAQELLMLRQDVLAYSPDLVLLAFFPANDVSDNSKALSHPSRTIPFFTLRDDELVLDSSFRESPAFKDRLSWPARVFYATQQHSRLVQLVYRMRGDIGEVLREGSVKGSFEPGLPNAVYKEPSLPEWEDAWQVTEHLIRQMAHEVRERGHEFGVVTLSTPVQANPDASARHQAEEALQVDDLFYPDRRIKALGEREGFPVLNLGRPFQEYASEHQVYLHGLSNAPIGRGHWNEKGHRLGAELIAEWLNTSRDWTELR